MTGVAECAADGEFGSVPAVHVDDLPSASVFSAADAASFDVPIVDEPEWLAMPAPLAAGEVP